LLVLIRPFILLAPGEAEQVSEDFLQRISLHPSAKDDLPALEVGAGEFSEFAPERVQGTQRALERVRKRARVWSIEAD
jgi:hypothetical protein